jgi:hypothetical protein
MLKMVAGGPGDATSAPAAAAPGSRHPKPSCADRQLTCRCGSRGETSATRRDRQFHDCVDADMGGRPRHDNAREHTEGGRDDVHDAVGRNATPSGTTASSATQGRFVNIQNNGEFPRGAWAYHETLIPNAAKKPLRIWLEVGSRDNGFHSVEDTYRNWALANNRIAEALRAKGYAYQYVWAQDAGHVEVGVERPTLEEAMECVWKRQ